MVSQFRKLLGKGVKILVYHGDTDMACNFLMGQQFTSKLGLQVLSADHSCTSPSSDPLSFQIKEQKRPWYTNKQIAGFVTRYKGLDFVTVKVGCRRCDTSKHGYDTVLGRWSHGSNRETSSVSEDDQQLHRRRSLLSSYAKHEVENDEDSS